MVSNALWLGTGPIGIVVHVPYSVCVMELLDAGDSPSGSYLFLLNNGGQQYTSKTQIMSGGEPSDGEQLNGRPCSLQDQRLVHTHTLSEP
jgi:hypothetical protein